MVPRFTSISPEIFISRITNPWLNLSLESYIFKSMPPEARRLVLYINDPCVVIGRNQNPWRECSVPLLKSMSIPLLRRRSGGGTVCHDWGNVNFSIMTPKEEFTRDRHARMIIDALNGLGSKVWTPLRVERSTTKGFNSEMNDLSHDPFSETSVTSEKLVEQPGPQVKLKLNDRYDIVTIHDKKVSGSAYKIERQKAYHHGTMLLNSKLDVLKALLHRSWHLGTIEGRGVASVKSPVANIGCDKNVFIDTVVKAFKALYSTNEAPTIITEETLPPEVREEALQMQTWEWTFGQTPLFVHTLTNPGTDAKVSITVDKGLVKEIDGLNVQVEPGMLKYTAEEMYRLTGEEWLANLIGEPAVPHAN